MHVKAEALGLVHTDTNGHRPIRYAMLELKRNNFRFYADNFSFRLFFSVIASAANFEIPSRSLSTAIASSLKSKRKADSLLR